MKLVIKVKHLVWSESLLVLNSSSGSQHDSDVLSACSTGFTRLWKQLRPSFFYTCWWCQRQRNYLLCFVRLQSCSQVKHRTNLQPLVTLVCIAARSLSSHLLCFLLPFPLIFLPPASGSSSSAHLISSHLQYRFILRVFIYYRLQVRLEHICYQAHRSTWTVHSLVSPEWCSDVDYRHWYAEKEKGD